jgi:hypothetical protein
MGSVLLDSPLRLLRAHLACDPTFSMPGIQGRERLRVSGPVLVVCNHVTYLDAGFVLAALPHRLRNLAIAMEGERVQRMRRPPRDWPWMMRLTFLAGYWLMTPLFHAFPLPQRGGFRESFRFAGDAASPRREGPRLHLSHISYSATIDRRSPDRSRARPGRNRER